MNAHAATPPERVKSPVFEAEGLTFRYQRAERPAISDLSLRIDSGEFVAILGPNGSGKSTLLRVLLGALRPSSGEAVFAGRSASEWPARALARRIGVVAQVEEPAFPVDVRELVAMGRYPHLGPWRSAGPADNAAVERAMARCEVTTFADRLVSNLSAGERQRARIARALAQEPDTLVLDEPTASLDIAHEMAIFELLDGFAADGRTVLLVTHNINLAARYASRLILLDRGRTVAMGVPTDVVEEATLRRVYGWPVMVAPHPGEGRDRGTPQVVPLRDQQHPRSE